MNSSSALSYQHLFLHAAFLACLNAAFLACFSLPIRCGMVWCARNVFDVVSLDEIFKLLGNESRAVIRHPFFWDGCHG